MLRGTYAAHALRGRFAIRLPTWGPIFGCGGRPFAFVCAIVHTSGALLRWMASRIDIAWRMCDTTISCIHLGASSRLLDREAWLSGTEVDMEVEMLVGIVCAIVGAILVWAFWQRMRDAQIVMRIKGNAMIAFPSEIKPLSSIDEDTITDSEVEWFVWREINHCRMQGSRELWKCWSALRRRRATGALTSDEYSSLLKRLLDAYDAQWNQYLAGAERLYGRDRVTILEWVLHP